MKRRSILITFFIYLLVLSTKAEVGNLEFEKLNKRNGLSHNRVQAILKSSKGFIWVGTLEGLNRYDGTKITVFLHDQKNKTSLSDNLVSCLYEDDDSILWIGTGNGGLNKYDRKTGTFSHFLPHNEDGRSGTNDVRSISPDENGDLWLGLYGGGICRFNKQTKEFENYQHRNETPNSVALDNIYSVLSDGNKLWIATSDNGLDLFDKKAESFKHYKHSTEQGSLSNNSVFSIFKDSKGDVWIGTGNGLNRYDSKNDKFISYFHNDNNPNSLANNIIVNISEDRFGRLWIATRSGLSCLNNSNTVNEYFTNYYYNPNDASSISGDDLQSIFIDQNNILWLGTFNNGLNKALLTKKPFIHYTHNRNDPKSLSKNIIRAIFEDKDGNLWVGTEEGGLNFKRKGSNNFERFGADKVFPNQVSIGQDRDGNMWFGSWRGGVCRLNYSEINSHNKRFHRYQNNPNDSTSISSNIVQDIFSDKDGRLWFGTEDGLCLYNKLNDNFEVIRSSTSSDNHLSDNRIQSNTIFQDSGGNIWVGTWNGLNRMIENNTESPITSDGILVPPHSIRFKSFFHSQNDTNSISSNKIISITEDTHNNLWIGTYGSGFNKFDKNTNHFISFSEKNGLVDNVVYSILEDKRDNLWMSTNDGLSCFSIKNKRFRNYDESDGLLSNYFYYGAAFKFKNGDLAFGSTNGFTTFNPNTIIDNSFVPPILLSDLLINNKSVDYGTVGSPLSVPIWNTNEITLPYTKNLITIEFVALNYIHPEKNNYAFKLEGFNDSWIFIGSKHSASYTNLDPGEYLFRVKGSNNNGIWNEEGATLKIIITPPFWATWWFLTLCLISIIGGITLFFYLRVNKIRRQRNLLKMMVEERTRELHETNSVLYNLNKELSEVNTLLEETNEEISEQKEQLQFQSDQLQIKSNEILTQNKLLETHQNTLEDIVKERTEELVAAKEKAEESERLKAAFLANMSHEIRTPLNAIVGFSSLLMMGHNDEEEIAQFNKQIGDNTEALLVLIDDILDLSKIEANQAKRYNKDFNVKDFTQGIYNHWLNHQSNSEIQVILNDEVKDENLTFFTDEHKLRQILSNLMGNACKFTEKGLVELGFKENENSYLFYVKDSGIGIAKNNLDVIFDYFRKIEDDNSKLYRGTGLGLAISKRLSEILGGELWVESVLEVGSTFYLAFPKKNILTLNR